MHIFSSFPGPLLALAVLAACTSPEPPSHTAVATTKERSELAFDSINALLVASPGKASLYDARADLYLAQDSLRAAQRDLETAVRLDSTRVNYRLRLGDVYYRTTQVDKAKVQFEKASELEPDNIPALLKQAEIQLVLRQYAKGMALVNQALRKDQHAAHGYYLKGWIHMETGDTALALSSFRTAVEQDAQDYSAYIMLGKLSAAQRDPLAADYYGTAITLRPNSVEAWYNKGMYYQENGEDSMALECYRHIMAIDSTNAVAWYNSGFVRMQHLHDLNGAKRDFSKAIELETNYADAWYNRGVAEELSNELDSAAANYQMAMIIRPDHDLAAAALDRLASKGVRIKIREGK